MRQSILYPDPADDRWLRAVAIALFLGCCALACSCSRGSEQLTSESAQRIVTVGGPVTEIAFALGEGGHIVGVDTSSVYPIEVTKLPQVGYQRTLSAESVLALSPDLVIASADAGPPAALEQLRVAGVKVDIIPVAATPEEAAKRIEAVGASLKLTPQALVLAEQLRRETTAARKRCCSGDGRPAARAVLVYARGSGTVMVAGTDTPASAMLVLAGARNVAEGFTGFKALSAEMLVEAAPEVIVVPSRGLASLGGEAGLLALPGVSDTPAGRERRIVAMDDLLLLGFGPRLGAAIDELSARLGTGR